MIRDSPMKNKIISRLTLLITIVPVFILPIFHMDLKVYGIFSVILIFLTGWISRINKDLFPTILFFTLVHVSRPLNTWFTHAIKLNFPGIFFLIPILVFVLLILTIPSIRRSIGCWRKDKIDTISVLLIIGLVVISGLALFVWGNYIAGDLHKFTRNLPDVALIWIALIGIGFALLNAFAEEFLARGMLCNGLEKIFSDKRSIIIIQAVVFSIFHYHGFPGGVIGMIMVFLWSIVLGIIRYRTKGLFGVVIGHFFADLTIYVILYQLK